MRSKVRTVSRSAAALLLLCGTAHADLQTQVLALSGEPAPGTSGHFDAFGNPRLNEMGEVLFWARHTANAAAANDDCDSAIPVGLGATFFTTHGAADSLPEGCASRSDVWFEFTDLSGEKSVDIQFYVSGVGFSQASLGVYEDDCGLLPLLACGGFVTVTFTPELRTVKLRVGSNAADQSGEGFLVVRQLGTPPVAASTTDGGLWKSDGSGTALVLHEGAAAVFDPTLVHESWSIASFTNFGAAVTGAVQATPPYTVTRGAVMVWEDGAPGATALHLDPVSAGPPLTAAPGPASLSDGGVAAFALLNGASIVYGATAHAAGDPAPGLPGLTWQNFDQPGLSREGHVAWRSRLAGTGVDGTNDVALWKDAGSGAALVVRTGQQAPMAKPGVVFTQIGADVGVDTAGAVAFWGEVDGPTITAANRSGVWSDRSGGLMPVVRAGELAPGLGGAAFASFARRPMMNSDGDIAALAYIAGGSSTATDNSGVWVFRANGSRRLVAREGQQVPGAAPGLVFGSFSDAVLNDRGDVAFVASLRGGDVTPATAQALFFAGAGRGLVQVVRTGDVVEVSEGDSRTVREILFGTGRPQGGHGQFNRHGTLLYQLAFTDRSTALLTTSVICPADFDGSGVVAVPDIFAYLAAWFGNLPSAEWDGEPGLTVADLFAYLNQWFTGC